jgi:hypothetical protein
MALASTRVASADDHDAAVEVWRAANVARGRPPGPERIERVRVKLAVPGAIVIVAVVEGHVRGMLLAEPGLEPDGSPIPGLCHLSMLFVDPGSGTVWAGSCWTGSVRTRKAWAFPACRSGPAPTTIGRSGFIGVPDSCRAAVSPPSGPIGSSST